MLWNPTASDGAVTTAWNWLPTCCSVAVPSEVVLPLKVSKNCTCTGGEPGSRFATDENPGGRLTVAVNVTGFPNRLGLTEVTATFGGVFSTTTTPGDTVVVVLPALSTAVIDTV